MDDIDDPDQQYTHNLEREVERLSRLVDRHAAELNRRRGEMTVARELLDELGVPKTKDGVTLTFRQRIKLLAAQQQGEP